MERSDRLRLAVFYWFGFAAIIAALAFVFLTIAGLQDDLRDANKARDALVEQVQGLGAKPVVGATGKTGARGEPGKDGINGVNGTDGSNGKDGTNGSSGKDGSNGKDGADGAAGKDGKDGADGAKGDKGDKGDTGADGPQGPAGKDGQTCPNGYSLGSAIVGTHNAMVCIQDQAFGKG